MHLNIFAHTALRLVYGRAAQEIIDPLDFQQPEFHHINKARPLTVLLYVYSCNGGQCTQHRRLRALHTLGSRGESIAARLVANIHRMIYGDCYRARMPDGSAVCLCNSQFTQQWLVAPAATAMEVHMRPERGAPRHRSVRVAASAAVRHHNGLRPSYRSRRLQVFIRPVHFPHCRHTARRPGVSTFHNCDTATNITHVAW